ncbi:MAG TPA: amino acid adenylation domain-containing protein, partial [Chitinophagaceae bacterium]|nr:amino acid adenylation domain-containing protein [Chitinophagaceae bacterium]
IADISAAAAYSPNDSTISWMPLTHDMGLIGFHLNPLFSGMHQYLIPTQVFVRNPALWLDKASEHQVSILCSPNFGYKYLLKHCDTSIAHKWDLSHVRIIYNGAEPISAPLCRQFLDSMQQYGLKKQAMCPVYGLAEATLAVSISGLQDEVIELTVNRHKLNLLDKVSIAAENQDAVSFVNVGRAIDHCMLQIRSDDHQPLPEETIGHITIKGPNVTRGYYNNVAETTNVLSEDGWLRTGDLGFLKNGCLYITGRAKDIIFVNGQNFYPHDIERVGEEVEGVELNKIAVAGYFNDDSGKEEAIAFVFHRGSIEKFVPLATALKMVVSSKTGLELDKVIPVKDIPRTTSGKLQRFKLLELYRQGRFAEAEQEMQRALNALHMHRQSGDKPATEAEEKLVAIWEQVLHVQPVGVNQHFFEIGGTSLKAAEMAMMVSKTMQVELPLELLYKKQTIRELAAVLPDLAKHTFRGIPKAEVKEYYPLSPAQKRLYYNWELDKHSIAYNIPVAFKIPEVTNAERLEACIQQLVQRHEALRTSFHMMGEPVFKVHERIEFQLEQAPDFRELVRPFHLSAAPLFRVALIDNGVLFADFHHIISDGVSVYRFVQELLELYRGKELPAQTVQYKDYVSWQAKRASSLNDQRAYWLNILQGELPLLALPSDFPRPAIFSTEGAKIEFSIGERTTVRLKELAKAGNCSLHVLLLTIYNLLLSKYTGQEDVITGIPVSGRAHADLLGVQGMFVNNLPLRINIPGDESFTSLLARHNNLVSAALKNQDLPFDELVNALGGKRDVSRNPVFDTMFIYQNMGYVNRHFFDPGFSKFDLSMEVFEERFSLSCAIEYATKLFRRETIIRFAQHFENLVNTIIADPQAEISTLGVMSSREYDSCTRKFNATTTAYPKDKTIQALFEEQVLKTPGNIAVVCDGEELSYAALNSRANDFAVKLGAAGLQPGDIAGVLMPRSVELIVAILGILKAGGCYLPIDTDLPAERIKYILDNSKCRLIVTEQAQIKPVCDERVKDLPRDLAYIIYTSGTTGSPKGVMISQSSLVNYIIWAAGEYVQREQVAFPLYTSISFDLTITSIFTPLITGNTIVVYNENGNDIPLERVIHDNKVQVIKLTPSHLRLLADARLRVPLAQSRIRRMIVGGEQLETKLAKEIYDAFGGRIEIYNEYGPTEATVGCMIHRFRRDEEHTAVPIGVPAANTQIYLLDQYLKPVPAGVHGELFISGDGIAKGYLFNEALTRQKFIPDPFTVGQRMYRTGDIAKRLHNGTLVYIGRADHQVKINGYRIELAEIEKQLENHHQVMEAVVITRKNNKDQQYLCAYYKSSHVIEESTLRSYLAGKLPHYMIPVHFVWLREIPLTRNGKIDRDALPDPEHNRISAEPLPANRIEALSLKIWSAVLNEPGVTLTDNFFELGGDSIKAVQIVSKLNEQGISLQAKDILTYHTIEQVSRHARLKGTELAYEQGLVSGQRPLTPIERWFFEQRFADPGYYNQSVLLQFKKEIDVSLLTQAFDMLIRHHDGLRQNYDAEKHCMFYNNAHLEKPFIIDKEIDPCFDLATDLLIRAAVTQQQQLLITA